VRSRVRDETFSAAFEELFRRAGIVAFRILGDNASAEEIAAEALARAYEHWHRIADLPYRDGWVLRVASNLAIDRARRRRPEVPAPGAVQVEDLVVLRLALVDALSRLPTRQREVVALRHLSGLSEVEIAATLGIAQGSVKTHLRRALEALRRQLGTDFGRDTVVI
jgi:RNA polymerase sigma-70 factor (ECF subfamily)